MERTSRPHTPITRRPKRNFVTRSRLYIETPFALISREPHILINTDTVDNVSNSTYYHVKISVFFISMQQPKLLDQVRNLMRLKRFAGSEVSIQDLSRLPA